MVGTPFLIKGTKNNENQNTIDEQLDEYYIMNRYSLITLNPFFLFPNHFFIYKMKHT